MIRIPPLLAALSALALATAVQAKTPEWIEKEYTRAGSPPFDEVEKQLNETCRPSGLDGIQMYGIQKGHEDAIHLHIACRVDGAKARYTATMATAPKGQIGGKVKAVMADPKVRIGPFHFGEAGGDDGVVLVTRTK